MATAQLGEKHSVLPCQSSSTSMRHPQQKAVPANSRIPFRYFHPTEPVKSGDILFAAGCTSLFDMIGHAIAEPEEAILLSRPCYQGFKSDFYTRARSACRRAYIHVLPSDPSAG